MTVIDYLNDLASDLDKYLLAGLKELFVALWSIDMVRNSFLATIALAILYNILRSIGFSRGRANFITKLIDAVSGIFSR